MKSTLREGLAPSPTCHTAARWFPRKWDVAVSTASVAEWPALALAGGLDDGANCIFIGATASLLCAPAIVRAASLMPVRRMRVRIAPQYAGFCERLMYQSLDSNWRADEMSTILNGAGRIDQAGTATAQDSSSASRLLIGFREEHLNGKKLCKTPANARKPMHTDPSTILNSFIREQRKNRSVHQQHVGRPGHEPIEHRAADGAGFYLPAGLPLRDLGRLATEEGVGGWAVRCRFLTSSKYATMLRCTSACCNAA
jgi:hypothetical protein